jgi:hypothetical protein
MKCPTTFTRKSLFSPSVLLGILVATAFLFIVGPNAIIPTNIAWLSSGDPAQHYLGWAFYRFSPWTNPIGLSPDYGMDISSSIVYSDSIPLMAILLKPFSAWLPATFQYLGIWALLCFVLQGYFAYLLIGRITKEPLLKILGAGFFIFAPAFLWRLGVHAAYASHFLILGALVLVFKPSDSGFKTKNMVVWLTLLCAALLISFYLFVMVLAMYLVFIVQSIQSPQPDLSNKFFLSLVLLYGILGSLLLLLLFHQAGYFVVTSLSTGNYGIGRINLLSIIDPDTWSYVLPNLKDVPDPFEPNARIYESFVYLGLGTIIAGLFTLYAVVKNKVTFKPLAKRYIYLVIALIGLALFAISNNIALGPWGFSIPISDSLRNSASILRASARLFWPVYYVLILMIVYGVIRGYSKKQAILILSICLLIQVADSSAGWGPKRKNLFMLPASSVMGTPLQSPFWEEAAKHYQNVVVILPQDGGSIDWKVFADYAAKYHLKTNSAYLARYDTAKLNAEKTRLLKQLESGQYDAHTLYILEDDRAISALRNLNPQQDLALRLDGYNLIAPGWNSCAQCQKSIAADLLTNLVPALGQTITFGRDAQQQFLVKLGANWAQAESWGAWSIGTRASLVLPIPKDRPRELVVDVRALVNTSKRAQRVKIYINGQPSESAVLTQSNSNQIHIPLNNQLLSGDSLEVVFELPDAHSPKSVGIGDDDRQLAIGIERAWFQ